MCLYVERLLDILLPSGGYVLTLVEAYFDESGGSDANSPIFCVAGYLYEKDACISIDKEWKKVLEDHHLNYFRMVECAHGNKEFDKRTKEERIEVQTKLINLIKKYALQGYSVSFDLRFSHLVPSGKAHGIEIISPYSLCCYWCLMAARNWADRNNYNGKIAYFFESGHANHAEANKIMNSIFDVPDLRDFYRYLSHSFADKKLVRPLQSADILAWQRRKNVKERMAGNNKTRADLLSLLESEHFTTHFDEKTLLDFRIAISNSNKKIEENRKAKNSL